MSIARRFICRWTCWVCGNTVPNENMKCSNCN